MFLGITSHSISFNGDISDWDVSSVTAMSAMFALASLLNGELHG